jgi:hypothetical protein
MIISEDGDALFDVSTVRMINLESLGLTTAERETVKVLVLDGWHGSLEELILCAKELN